jgi:hypothetical protein
MSQPANVVVRLKRIDPDSNLPSKSRSPSKSSIVYIIVFIVGFGLGFLFCRYMPDTSANFIFAEPSLNYSSEVVRNESIYLHIFNFGSSHPISYAAYKINDASDWILFDLELSQTQAYIKIGPELYGFLNLGLNNSNGINVKIMNNRDLIVQQNITFSL